MKKFLPIALLMMCGACNFMWKETIDGNGNLTSEQRNISPTSGIESRGSFDVVITQGSTESVKVEADANLLPYIITEHDDGNLVIRAKNGVNLSSSHKITVYITTEKLENVELSGSGNISGNGKFTGGDHLKLSIAGTGDISLEVNTPKINSSIAGSGNIILAGETKDSKIDIAGVGDYKAEELKSENVEVHIAGSGSTKVYADATLDVHIAGSGDVYYKGTPNIKSSIAGSGNIKQLQ